MSSESEDDDNNKQRPPKNRGEVYTQHEHQRIAEERTSNILYQH